MNIAQWRESINDRDFKTFSQEDLDRWIPRRTYEEKFECNFIEYREKRYRIGVGRRMPDEVNYEIHKALIKDLRKNPKFKPADEDEIDTDDERDLPPLKNRFVYLEKNVSMKPMIEITKHFYCHPTTIVAHGVRYSYYSENNTRKFYFGGYYDNPSTLIYY